jgi:hypothetical protein
MVTLRIGGAGGAGSGGDAVADGDVHGPDEDVLDDQPEDALAFVDIGGVGPVVQLGEEGFDVGGEGEVALAVGLLGVEGVELVAQVGLPGA